MTYTKPVDRETAAAIYQYADDQTRHRILIEYRLTWGELIAAAKKGRQW